MGFLEWAEPLYLEAKAIRAEVLGENHPDYATSLNKLVALCREMGSFEKAEPLCLEAKATEALLCCFLEQLGIPSRMCS